MSTRRRFETFTLAATLLSAACASQPPATPQSLAAEPQCVTSGTRVRQPEGACPNQPGRVITREEIDTSPGRDTADVVRRLAPW